MSETKKEVVLRLPSSLLNELRDTLGLFRANDGLYMSLSDGLVIPTAGGSVRIDSIPE